MKRKGERNNDIYIDCQPVNKTGDSLIDFNVTQKGLSVDDDDSIEKSGDKITDIISNPLFGLVIGGVGLFLLVKATQLGMRAFGTKGALAKGVS